MRADLADTPVAQLLAHPYLVSLQTLARLQSESLRFIAARAAKDLAFARSCGALAAPADLVELGTTFAVETADDYVRESMALFAIAAGNFEDTASALI